MICPFCLNPDTKVTDKRDTAEITRRRRECLKCEKRFTTYERIEKLDVIIIKKDGRREHFNIDKLKQGISKACEKRPISHEKINRVVKEIEENLKRKGKEIPSNIVGEMVMKKLRKLDKVAYIRFASVYREFKDLQTFQNELKVLIKK